MIGHIEFHKRDTGVLQQMQRSQTRERRRKHRERWNLCGCSSFRIRRRKMTTLRYVTNNLTGWVIRSQLITQGNDVTELIYEK
uniref:Uncharacterized protein n=1 Tax=Steinernema glaseri TaxID=37863 RepID=A0A1I7ZAF5_9BILA